MTDTTIHLTIVVKGDGREARRVTALHMNDWFHQDIGPAPYPVGSLLHWGYDSGTWRDEEAEKDRTLAEARDLRIPVGPAHVLETANKIDDMIRGN